jgi:hypothetical protein
VKIWNFLQNDHASANPGYAYGFTSSTYSANPQRSSFSAVTGPVETHAFSTWNYSDNYSVAQSNQ